MTTAVDTAADLGADIRYQGPDRFETMARPVAKRPRALRRARVSVCGWVMAFTTEKTPYYPGSRFPRRDEICRKNKALPNA